MKGLHKKDEDAKQRARAVCRPCKRARIKVYRKLGNNDLPDKDLERAKQCGYTETKDPVNTDHH